MGLSYQEVLVDVVRYKYLCDEGFISSPLPSVELAIQSDGFFRHLVQCVTEDTGFTPEMAELGVIHSALQHGCVASSFFEAVVTEIYA